ncbi:unnamed protein product [Caenorhabditis brenneri]
MNFPLLADKTIYGFIAGNLKSEDCSSVRERVDCSINEETESANQCKKGLESAYNMLMVMSTTTQNMNGSVNLAPNELEKIADTVFSRFIEISKNPRKKKKNGPDASGMTSGTTSKTNSMSKSGTTKQTTATGTFQKTDQTGTNVTGVQRY